MKVLLHINTLMDRTRELSTKTINYMISKKICNTTGEFLRQYRLKLYEMIVVRSSDIYLQMDKEIIDMSL